MISRLKLRIRLRRTILWILIGLWAWGPLIGEDRIELKSGITLSGDVISITESAVTLEITAGTRKLTRRYPLDRIKAVTVDGARRTFESPSSRTDQEESPPPRPTEPPTRSGMIQRSEAEVTRVINQQGRKPPSWYSKTSLDFPDTLDLSWPNSKPPTWNYTQHVEHYIWDIINSNRSRYGNGVRFMHHLLEVNQDQPDILRKVMNELGRMYFEFFDDYARAAFWWQRANVTTSKALRTTDSPARLAECYWRLGNRRLAETTLEAIPLTFGVIKLWGDLMETDRAVALTQSGLEEGLEASELYVLAGDALRTAERYDQSIVYYRKALELEAAGSHREQIERNQRRAQGTIELIELFDQLKFTDVSDGEYRDQSYGYAGNVSLRTTMAAGQLTAIHITSLSDKQYYHAVDATIHKILKRQTVQGIDAVSGATVTSEAVIRATAKALAQGTR